MKYVITQHVLLTMFLLILLQCAFSNGGHLFAAVSTNLIQLFATYTFDNIGNLKGHNGKVIITHSCIHEGT